MDLLSIRGIENVMRLVGLGADGRDGLCDESLQARLLWSVQSAAETQGKCFLGFT